MFIGRMSKFLIDPLPLLIEHKLYFQEIKKVT